MSKQRPALQIRREMEFVVHILQAFGAPRPHLEYRFHPDRKWRFDIAWPAARVALEIEGGAWIYGRHNRPHGFIADIEKYNEATFMGWAVVRATPQMLEDAQFLARLAEFIRGRMEIEDE